MVFKISGLGSFEMELEPGVMPDNMTTATMTMIGFFTLFCLLVTMTIDIHDNKYNHTLIIMTLTALIMTMTILTTATSLR